MLVANSIPSSSYLFRQELHTLYQCADLTTSDRHLTQGHQGDSGRAATAKTLVHTGEKDVMV